MTDIAPHITAFLNQRLEVERAASPHTRDTYAYAFQLLFGYASQKLGVRPSALQLEQIDAPLILEFRTPDMVSMIPVRSFGDASAILLDFGGMGTRSRKKGDSLWSAPTSEIMGLFLGFLGVCQEIWSSLSTSRKAVATARKPATSV